MDISYTKLPGTSQNVRQSGQVEQLFGRQIHCIKSTFLQGDNIPYRILYKLIDDKIAHEDMSTFSGGAFRGVLWLDHLDQRALEGDYLNYLHPGMALIPATHSRRKKTRIRARTTQRDTVRSNSVPYETVRKWESGKKTQESCKKKAYETVRGNSSHVHSISRTFPPSSRWKCRKARLKFAFDFSMPAKIVCSNYLAFFC